MSDPTLQDIEERFLYRDMAGIDGKDVTYLLRRIAQLEAELALAKSYMSKTALRRYESRIKTPPPKRGRPR